MTQDRYKDYNTLPKRFGKYKKLLMRLIHAELKNGDFDVEVDEGK